MQAYHTAAEVAAQFSVRIDTVLSWIHDGSLIAINVARRPGGRPRWRIAAEALEQFVATRSAQAKRVPARRRRRAGHGVIEFF